MPPQSKNGVEVVINDVIISATETVMVADHGSQLSIPPPNTIKYTLFFHKSLSGLKSQLVSTRQAGRYHQDKGSESRSMADHQAAMVPILGSKQRTCGCGPQRSIYSRDDCSVSSSSSFLFGIFYYTILYLFIWRVGGQDMVLE